MIESPIATGYTSTPVTIECALSNGLPSFTIVGLATKAVDESKERIRAAIHSTGYAFPKKKIIVNLAPADIPKNTASLDVAIALSILMADKQIVASKDIIAIGELSLNGEIRSVKGIIGLLRSYTTNNNKEVFIPLENVAHAKALQLHELHGAKSLREIVDHLNATKSLASVNTIDYSINKPSENQNTIDFSEIVGQEAAKRALIIAAAGGHNILLSGPPGTGKSMLAKAFIGILPNLQLNESLETSHIHSLAGYNTSDLMIQPPLRLPHHTASTVSIIGGGLSLKPGEISLAHNGVLFMDELPEFQRSTIESLRQPLEDAEVTITRAQHSTTYPCDFILIATSNPCPCGYYGSSKECTCSAQEINRYQKKLSGPIVDRIDIHFTVSMIDHKNLLKISDKTESIGIKNIVATAREKQRMRANRYNAKLSNKQLKDTVNLEPSAKEFLNIAAEKMDISARAYMKIVKVGRTIADLENKSTVQIHHITEALQYRPKQTYL